MPYQSPEEDRENMTPRLRLGHGRLREPTVMLCHSHRNIAPVMHAEVKAMPRRPRNQYDARSASDYTSRRNMAVMRSDEDFDSGYFEVNAIAPGPDWSDDIICAAGSNRGILQWKGDHCTPLGGSLSWTAPTMTDRLTIDNAFQDIFAVEFRRSHENVIFGGGRPGRCFVADTRVRDLDWLSFRHGSSIAHIKSLNEYHVLISGMQNLMRIYDVRMVKGRNSIVSRHVSRSAEFDSDRSIISFPEYQNEAHHKIGFDVDLDAGIVATAHDDGKVALHSLRSGHRLISPEVDLIQADLRNRGPVKAMQFEKLPGDLHSSLFVAVGNNLKTFSLGTSDSSKES